MYRNHRAWCHSSSTLRDLSQVFLDVVKDPARISILTRTKGIYKVMYLSRQIIQKMNDLPEVSTLIS